MLKALGIIKVWWPWAIMLAVFMSLTYAFWWFDRVWLGHHEELEGCRHWCTMHVKYDTQDKYVACVRKCKEALK
jgi:hypothetical protein